MGGERTVHNHRPSGYVVLMFTEVKASDFLFYLSCCLFVAVLRKAKMAEIPSLIPVVVCRDAMLISHELKNNNAISVNPL